MLRSRGESRPSRLGTTLRRLVKAAAILAGLTALGLLSGYVAMQLTIEPGRVEIPRVGGLDSVAASEMLKEAGLVPRMVAEEFSATIPPGHVVSQRPARGTRVKIGEEVQLILSRGSDRLPVPDIRGQSLPQARRTLLESGLTPGPVLQIHSDLLPVEHVIAQDPPPRAAAIRGNSVTLLQSLGPLNDLVTVPDLRGREMVAALNLLKELQLEGRVSFQEEASRQGRILQQDPPPGEKLRVGGQVRITAGE